LVGLRSQESVYAIKTTYDPSFYAFSPGVILFYRVIEELCSRGDVRHFDFGRGDEQYKREWSPAVIQQKRVTIQPNVLRRRVLNGPPGGMALNKADAHREPQASLERAREIQDFRDRRNKGWW
jgi:CelD/BcsL family acetyltransferase involved in cellulose biosynthesis